MLLTELVLTSQAVAATPGVASRSTRSPACSDGRPAEVPVAVAFLSGELLQRQIGVGYAALAGMLAGDGAADGMTPALTLTEVDSAFGEIGAVTGPGPRRRAGPARRPLRPGHAGEREFLVRLLAGDLGQGALEGVMTEAVARAAGVPADEVRRAHQLGGSLPEVAMAALRGGPPPLPFPPPPPAASAALAALRRSRCASAGRSGRCWPLRRQSRRGLDASRPPRRNGRSTASGSRSTGPAPGRRVHPDAG